MAARTPRRPASRPRPVPSHLPDELRSWTAGWQLNRVVSEFGGAGEQPVSGAGAYQPAEQPTRPPRRCTPAPHALERVRLGPDLAAVAQHRDELDGEALDSLAFEVSD